MAPKEDVPLMLRDEAQTSQSNEAVKQISDNNTQSPTPWPSVYICGVGAIIQATQFHLYFSSMWPYLRHLDPNVEETMLGYIVALYSLAQCIAAPSFGYWANRMNQVRIPLMTGFSCMLIGNFIYLCVQFLPGHLVPFGMMFARFITGVGTGNATLLRTYVASASTFKDRSRAISCVTGGFALGTLLGPTLQLLFTRLNKEGIMIGPFQLNIYTGPAIAALVMNVSGILIFSKFFKEQYQKHAATKGADGKSLLARPDLVAIGICVFTRFSQIFLQTTIGTIGSPYSMMMFSFDKEQAVMYNSAAHAVAGIIGAVIYVFFVVFDASKLLPARSTSIVCLCIMFMMFLATFSWPILGNPVEPRINGSDEGCDFDRFGWCDSLTTVNPWIYYGFYVLLFGVATSCLNVSLTTLFSKIFGPRKQGTLQGVFQMAGSIGRMTAPLLTSSFYTLYGPRLVWSFELVEIFINIAVWLIFLRRMVPFKSDINH